MLVTPNEFIKLKNVLVAYDGGIESNKALKTACELLTFMKSSLTVVFVTDDDEKSSELTAEVREFTGHYQIDTKIEWLRYC